MTKIAGFLGRGEVSVLKPLNLVAVTTVACYILGLHCNLDNIMRNFLTLSEFHESLLGRKALLGIDWGSKKIGISVTDAERAFVFPLAIIPNSGVELVADKILKIIESRGIGGIVMGNPLKLDGSLGNSAADVQKFAETLVGRFGLPMIFQDERFTTRLVHREWASVHGGRAKCPADMKDDSVAACYIVQTTLALLNAMSGAAGGL